MQALITARSLYKCYGDFTAVDHIDFDVLHGECFGFVGPNGAGKTSTMRMTTCMSPPSGGELLVDGLDVRSDHRRIKARLGVVSQDDNLDGDLTVRENLLVYARYFDISRAVAAPAPTKFSTCSSSPTSGTKKSTRYPAASSDG